MSVRDTYADGTPSVVTVLRPRGSGWQEISGASRYTFGYPARSFFFAARNLFVISAVEVASDGKVDKGFEYHLSVSKPSALGPTRCDSNEAKWALDQFGLEGAEEDNHVPYGVVRNFWRPVASRLVGLECECKAEEPAIREDGGDFVWRSAPPVQEKP